MKTLLLKILVFLILIVIAFPVLSYLGDKGLKEAPLSNYKKWRSFTKPIDADILLIGNSRMLHHINTSIVDSLLHVNSYNLGFSGGPYEISDVAWHIYEKHSRKKPRLIICNVDYRCFGNYHMPFSKTDYIPFYSDTLFSPIIDQLELPWIEKEIPLIKYIHQGPLLLKGVSSLFTNKNGYEGLVDKGYIGLSKDLHYRNGPLSASFERGKERLCLFDKFLNTCSIRGIPVVFLKSPIHSDLFEHLTGFDDSIALIDSLSISRNIVTLDYTNFSSDTTLFYDRIHLNECGANLLTVQLCHDLDSLIRKGEILF